MNVRERRDKHHAHDGAAADAVSRSMFPILARGLIDFSAVAPVLPRQSHHRIVQLGVNCQHAIGRWWEWAEKPVLPTGNPPIKPQSQSFYSSLLPAGGANLRGTPQMPERGWHDVRHGIVPNFLPWSAHGRSRSIYPEA